MWFMLDNVFNYRSDYVASVLASIETIENEPNLKTEFEKQKIFLLGSHISGQAQTGLTKPINSVNELKGRTLRTIGGAKTLFWQNLGVNPIFMAFGELYEALGRGTVDGIGDCAISLANTFKLYEVIKVMYMADAGGVVAGGLCINTDVWKKIPKDLQKVLLDLRHDYGIRYAQQTMDLEAVLYKEWQTKHGVKVQYPTPEDQKTIQAAGLKANADLIKKQVSEGHRRIPEGVGLLSGGIKETRGCTGKEITAAFPSAARCGELQFVIRTSADTAEVRITAYDLSVFRLIYFCFFVSLQHPHSHSLWVAHGSQQYVTPSLS